MNLINLRHMTFKKALVYAKLVAGMTNEEIAEAAGISLSQVSRYFQEHDAYTPAPALLPVLCKALNNTILVDWLNAQIEDMRPSNRPITTTQELSTAVMESTKNTGELSGKALEFIADGILSKDEAISLQAILKAHGEHSLKLGESLEPLAKGLLVDPNVEA